MERKRRKEATPMVMKATLRLREPLWRAGRIRALEERTSFQDLVARALEQYLKAPMKKRREEGGR